MVDHSDSGSKRQGDLSMHVAMYVWWCSWAEAGELLLSITIVVQKKWALLAAV